MEEIMQGLDSFSRERTGVRIDGPAAEEIVSKIKEQVDAWGLVLPYGDPLVLDFGLGDYYTTGETEFWIANEVEGGYCGKFMFLFEGQTCPNHMHKDKLETFFIVKGKVLMIYDDKEIILNPGDILLIDLTKYHRFTGLENSLILEVSKPCIGGDSHFSNTDIPHGDNYQGKSS